ncbi:DNA cytosine methyltransferase [Neptunomonas sp. XY-337]|uniref:DNA cytosine methyltransferase n=1 Tax=Neptunomonas sp. XY-337 TaxID=2561897 RepID=UPI0010AA9538|nr:DNA cytosine methyltransferase [Neptunomonas sp. XY-337]
MTSMFRVDPQGAFNFSGLLIDNFAGGGGASTGIEAALGRPVDIAVNHDPEAIRMHTTNHPQTQHYCESVWEVDPRTVTQGRPVDLAWFSPDCKHFSKAKGGKPVEKNIRGLAWVAVRYAATVKPRIIMLENVEEFKTWGPVVDGKPCPVNKGRTFKSFKRALERHGYKVEHRELVAADYGAPTTRKRFFLVARSDGQPIQWPEPTHGDPKSEAVKSGRLKPWRTAAEIIDWTLPSQSIFDRKRPLAEKTMLRIAKGLEKFVFNNPEPFLVTYYGEKKPSDFRGKQLSETLPTQTTENRFALVEPLLAPFITEHANASNQRNMSANEPVRTLCAQVKGGHFAVVTPILDRQFGASAGSSVEKPLGAVLAGGGGKTALVSAFIAKHYGGVTGHEAQEPLHTITSRGTQLQSCEVELSPAPSKAEKVRAFLLKYYGTNIGADLNHPLHTVPTKDRFGLVTIHGELYQITDIRMRMLAPQELYAAQGFPSDYIIDRDFTGKSLTKTSQVARCGNSVCPPVAEALVRANMITIAEEVAA